MTRENNCVNFQAPPPATSKKKKADEDTSPFMTLTETKEKRFKEEKALKVNDLSAYSVRLNLILKQLSEYYCRL